MSERRKPPNDRKSITHKFVVGMGDPQQETKGYVTVGLYDDNTPCEIFVQMNKNGSTISGLMDALSVIVSLALQYGVPLAKIVEKMTRTHFEPYGRTNNSKLPRTSSILDYLFRWLAEKYVKEETT